jgi:hypothetical protein
MSPEIYPGRFKEFQCLIEEKPSDISKKTRWETSKVFKEKPDDL